MFSEPRKQQHAATSCIIILFPKVRLRSNLSEIIVFTHKSSTFFPKWFMSKTISTAPNTFVQLNLKYSFLFNFTQINRLHFSFFSTIIKDHRTLKMLMIKTMPREIVHRACCNDWLKSSFSLAIRCKSFLTQQWCNRKVQPQIKGKTV